MNIRQEVRKGLDTSESLWKRVEREKARGYEWESRYTRGEKWQLGKRKLTRGVNLKRTNTKGTTWNTVETLEAQWKLVQKGAEQR